MGYQMSDYISIHALREEGDCCNAHSTGKGCISIHALREEGDDVDLDKLGNYLKFLSTPSARRATNVLDFCSYAERFLSTPSARRATPRWLYYRRAGTISIHALREEGDLRGGLSEKYL